MARGFALLVLTSALLLLISTFAVGHAADGERVSRSKDAAQLRETLLSIESMEAQLDSVLTAIGAGEKPSSRLLFERDELRDQLREAYRLLDELRAEPELRIPAPKSLQTIPITRRPERPRPSSRPTATQKVKSYQEFGFGDNLIVLVDELVKGDVIVFRGDIRIEGTVEGDVIAVGGDLELGSRATVGGQVVACGGELDVDPRADVAGRTVSLALPFLLPTQSASGSRWMALAMDALKLGFFALFAGLLLVAVPRRLSKATTYLDSQFLSTLR